MTGLVQLSYLIHYKIFSSSEQSAIVENRKRLCNVGDKTIGLGLSYDVSIIFFRTEYYRVGRVRLKKAGVVSLTACSC